MDGSGSGSSLMLLLPKIHDDVYSPFPHSRMASHDDVRRLVHEQHEDEDNPPPTAGTSHGHDKATQHPDDPSRVGCISTLVNLLLFFNHFNLQYLNKHKCFTQVSLVNTVKSLNVFTLKIY